MKKLIAAVLTAFLMASGLVALSGSGAEAACTRYAGCRSTQTTISGPGAKNNGESVTFSTAVTVTGSNAAPRGTVRIIVTGAGQRNQGFSYSMAKRAKRVNSFTFGAQFRPGKYTVRAYFQSGGAQRNSASRTLGLKSLNN